MSRFRSVCFTLNNYNEGEVERLSKGVEEGWAKYMLFGKEKAPETGTEHLQGYVNLKSGCSLKSLKKKLGERCHIEKAKGSVEDNYKYCTKDGNYLEFGEKPLDPSEKGEKEVKRWRRIRELAEAGNFDEIDDQVLLLHRSKLEQHYNRIQDELVVDQVELNSEWLCGEAGCGKSKTAREENPGFYYKMMNKWWDGYKHEDVVILEDVDPSHASWLCQFLKVWTDRYSFRAEFKGGSKMIRPKKIVITSQYTIEEVFGQDEKTVAALKRRVKVRNFNDRAVVQSLFQ